MRLGLAGTGRIGTRHAATLLRSDRVDEVILADANPARARRVADDLGAGFASDVDTLFAAGPDGLVIAAATDAHPELILRAVEAGIPAFCEKPVAPDLAATLDVVAAVAAAGVPVQVGFQRRFDAGFAAARTAVATGELGRIHTLRSTTLDPAPPPPEYVATSGGLFRDCGVHDFDIIRWVTGREIVEAYAVGADRGAEFFRAVGDVDTAGAVLTLDDGAIALVSLTRYNGAGYDVRLEVHGSAGTIAAGLDERLPIRSAEPRGHAPAGPPYADFLDRFGPAYAAELAAFVDLVADGGESPCPVTDALAAFRVAEACDRSRREHRPVAITP